MMEIIIGNMTDIIVALIGAYFLYSSKKSDAKAEERKKESRLLMKMMNANTELTECVAMNQINGDDSLCNVQKAMEKVKEARQDYDEFLEGLKAERFY